MLRLTRFAFSKARTTLARRPLHTTTTIDSVELSKVQQEAHKEPEVPEPSFTIPPVRIAQIIEAEKERAAVFEARAIEVNKKFRPVPSFFQKTQVLSKIFTIPAATSTNPATVQFSTSSMTPSETKFSYRATEQARELREAAAIAKHVQYSIASGRCAADLDSAFGL